MAVLNAPSKNRKDLPDLPITLLYDEIWQRHADLRYCFDVDRVRGRLAYLRWLVEFGMAEIGIPAAFLTVARAALQGEWVRQGEAGADAAAPSLAAGYPDGLQLPATADTVAALIAAQDNGGPSLALEMPPRVPSPSYTATASAVQHTGEAAVAEFALQGPQTFGAASERLPVLHVGCA